MEPNLQNTTSDISPKLEPVDLQPQQKHGYSLMSKILFILMVLVGVVIIVYVSTLLSQNRVGIPNTETNETSPTQADNANKDPFSAVEDEWKDFNNKQYQFQFKYPSSARTYEENPFSLDPSTYTVIFSRSSSTETEENLTEGYLFKVTINKGLVNRDLLKIAQDRQNFYMTQCPAIAKAGVIEKTKISGFDAQMMTIDNCNFDIKEIFILKDEFIYQLTLKYIGDLGYKQFYKTTAEEILKSFSITNLIAPNPTETWVTFKREEIEFKHPTLDETCCTIQGPATIEEGKPRKLAVFADPTTVSEGSSAFNGFGLFMIDNIRTENFTEYMDKQKAALVENYRIVIGKNPTTSEKLVLVDGVQATLLEGYAWWGDLLFIPITKTSRVLVISKSEVSPGGFDNLFGEILSTFRVADTENPAQN